MDSKHKIKKVAITVGKFALAFLGAPVVFIIGVFPSQYLTTLVSASLPEYIFIPIALSIPIIAVWLYIYLIRKKFGLRRDIWLTGVSGILFFLIILPIVFSVFVSLDGDTRERSRDARRISDLGQLQLAIQLYADDNGSLFPPISPSCSNIEILEEHLVPNYMSRIPNDPINVSNSPPYQVAISTDRKFYVFKVKLEKKRHNNLGNDVDGNVMGCNCDDPYYCVVGDI